MSEENVAKELSNDELDEVSGGYEYAVRAGDHAEYWYRCSGCMEYKELIYSGKGGVRVFLEGTVTCPNCGHTGGYSVHIG